MSISTTLIALQRPLSNLSSAIVCITPYSDGLYAGPHRDQKEGKTCSFPSLGILKPTILHTPIWSFLLMLSREQVLKGQLRKGHKDPGWLGCEWGEKGAFPGGQTVPSPLAFFNKGHRGPKRDVFRHATFFHGYVTKLDFRISRRAFSLVVPLLLNPCCSLFFFCLHLLYSSSL